MANITCVRSVGKSDDVSFEWLECHNSRAAIYFSLQSKQMVHLRMPLTTVFYASTLFPHSWKLNDLAKLGVAYSNNDIGLDCGPSLKMTFCRWWRYRKTLASPISIYRWFLCSYGENLVIRFQRLPRWHSVDQILAMGVRHHLLHCVLAGLVEYTIQVKSFL